MRPWAPLLLAILPLLAPAARAGNDPSGVVLLVNEESPDSAAIGAHYAAKRLLPPVQVVRLRFPVKPEFSFEEYRAAVEEPLRAHLSREGLEERARCLVLTRGIPVRVRFARGGHVSTAALLGAMDLPFCGIPQGGGIPGTPMDVLQPGERVNPFRDGPFPEDRRPGGRPLRLVTSLDGWSAADAKALVDRSVAADAGPPADPLFVFQDANGGAAGRNAEYPAGAASLKSLGFRTESHPVGGDLVKGRRDLMGWMSGGAYSGLKDEVVATNGFAPGALVDMLESFGAVPQNFDEKAGRSQFPVPVMVRAGAAGVHGAVAEPYAHTFCDVRLFERYAAGFDLAESFHASLPYLYWMNLVLGDPLCAPFARRPAVALEGLPPSATSPGPIPLKVRAVAAPGGEAPVAGDLFVDGRPFASWMGAGGEAVLHAESLADGDHLVLAVARCEGPTRTRGWTAGTLTVAIPAGRIVRWEPGRPEAEWSGSLPSGARLVVLDGDRAVEGTSRVDAPARRIRFEPRSPLVPGRTYGVRPEGFASPEARFTVGATLLKVEGPDAATAGDTVTLRVSADASLSRERLEVRFSDPPVLAALLDLPDDGGSLVEVPVTLRRAGAAAVEVRARRSGASATLPIAVKAGPAVSLFLRIASNTPIGEPFDVTVEARDAFGNPAADWTGTIALSAPRDPRASLPPPAAAGSGGRAVFRGVVLETPGRQVLVARGGGLEGADDTMAEATTIRRWFVAGPFDGKAVPADPSALRPADGAVIGDRPWRFRTSSTPSLEAGREKGVLLAVAYLAFPAEADAVLHLAAGGPVKAWLAGKPVPEGDRVPVRIPAGPAALVLRIEVRGEGKDDVSARFAAPDGSPIQGLRVLAARPFPSSSLSIAGTIRDGKGPVAGAEVRLSGPRSLRTRTDARGWYGFGDLRPGSWRVGAAVKGRKVEPESRAVDLKEAEATAVDFAVK